MSIHELYAGVGQPEGPVSDGPDSWIVTDMSSGAINRVGRPGEDRTLLARTGRPNGLAMSADGALWIAESLDPCLMWLGVGDSEPTVVTAEASDERLLWPNDLCIGPDGLIYLTDSGIEIGAFGEYAPSRHHEAKLDGRVVVVDPVAGTGRILDRGLQFANGIAIGPDDATLYVAETLTGLIHSYPLSNISADTREVFADVLTDHPESYNGVAGPDGMAFDVNGVLLVAVLTQGSLTTVSPRGEVLEHLALPDSFPTNVAFGGPDQRTVLITGCATGALYGMDWPARGLPLHLALRTSLGGPGSDTGRSGGMAGGEPL